jgi:regulator of replication initiation timing
MRGKSNRLFSWLSALIVLSALFSTPVFSQNIDQKVKELEKKITQLEQRIVKLEETILQLQKNQAKPVAASANKWKDKANWRLLRKGMNKSDVERILGEPPKVVANVHYGDIWYYPDTQGGNASFNTENMLTSWNEI